MDSVRVALLIDVGWLDVIEQFKQVLLHDPEGTDVLLRR